MAPEATGEDKDQSMEEILQSIKRIIADDYDDEEEAEAPMMEPEDPVVAAEEPVVMAEDPVEEPVGEPSTDEDDILELTEIIESDPEPEAPAAPETIGAAEDPLGEILSDDAAAASAGELQKLRKDRAEMPPRPQLDSPEFRSGVTVEDLVLEAIRPMLKEWLDENLPTMVKDLVEREIRRISH